MQFESMKGDVSVEHGTIHFPAYELVPISSHAVSSGSVATHNLKIGTVTDYKRVPANYSIKIANVKELTIHPIKDMLSKGACWGLAIPDTDYRLVFRTDEMVGGVFHIYAHNEELDTILAALSVFSPEIQFH